MPVDSERPRRPQPAAEAGSQPSAPAAASRWEAAANATWAVLRRVHLGTRKPGNWVQLFHFAVVGGSGYVVNLIVGAFVVAVTNNFLLNRHWTFRRQGSAEAHAGFQAARFFTVSVVGLGVNLVALELLVSTAGLPELLSQAIAVAVATPVNFIGNKLWTFDR